MNNQFWFNGSFSGSLVWNTVNDTLNNMNNYKEEVKNKYDAQVTNDLEQQFRKLTECSFATTDEKTKGMNDCGANLAQMELIIKQAAEAHGSDAYRNLGTGQILPRYVSKNPKRANLSEAALRWDFPVDSRARQIGASQYIAKPSTQQEWEIKYNPGKQESRLWKSVKNIAKWVGITSLISEWVWDTMLIGGNYLQNRTYDRTAQDIAQSKRYNKIGDLREYYTEELDYINKKIKELKPQLETQHWSQVQEEIEILNWKKKSIENRLSELPTENIEPLDTKWVAKELWLFWSDEMAALQASEEADKLWVTEIQPLINKSTETFDVWKIISEIWREDFWVDEVAYKEIKKILDEYKKIYSQAKYKNVPLTKLKEIYDEIWLSKEAIQWWEVEQYKKLVKDKIHTKLRTNIFDTLERENPEANVRQLYSKWSKTKELENELTDYAISKWKRSAWKAAGSIKNTIKEWTLWNAGVQRTVWEKAAKIWDNMRVYSKWGWGLLKKIGNKIWETKVWKKIANSKLAKNFTSTLWKWVKVADPIWFIQLLWLWWDIWDELLWWPTQLWEITDILQEIPWVKAWEVVEEMNTLRYEWNHASDEERVQILMDMWNEDWQNISYEDALKSYNLWKWDWDWKINSSSEPIKSVKKA